MINTKNNFLFAGVVGSTQKFGTESTNDIDLRGPFIPELSDAFDPWVAYPKFERRDIVKQDGKKYDVDGWELRYFVRQIERGNILLLSSLFSNDYPIISDIGKEAIENRSKFLGRNIQAGTLKFTGQKIAIANSDRKAKYHKAKYLYYALSDLLAGFEMLSERPKFPINSEHNNLLKSLKQSNERFDEGQKTYNSLKESFILLKNPHEFNRKWVTDWTIRAYKTLI